MILDTSQPMLLSNTPVILFALDAEGRFTLSEGRGLDFLGLNPGEAVGRSLFEVFPDFPGLATYFKRTLEGETRSARVELGGRTFEAWGSPRHDATGAVVGITGFALDVTPLRALEQQTTLLASANRELFATQRSLERILNLIPDPVFVKNCQFRYVLVNDAFCELVGRSRLETLGKTDPDLFPADEASVFRANDDLVLMTGLENANEERITTAAGQTRMLLTKKTRYLNESGHAFVVGITRDVTERKHLESELRKAWRESVHRYQALATVSPVGIFHTDPEGRIRFVNERWTALTGMEEQEAQVKGWLGAVHPEERDWITATWRRSIREQSPFTAEFRFLTPDGNSPWVLGQAIPVQSDFGDALGYVGTLTDVTRLKEVTQEVVLRTAELQQAQELHRLKTEFVNAVSHDLRTPLTSIIGYAEFLEDSIGGNLSPTQESFVRQIQQGAKRLEHLVNDLLDVARIEAGTFRLRLAETDLADKIREIAESLQPLITGSWLTLSVDLPADPLPVMADPQRIGQVLTNLTHNAIKFTPAGGTVRIRAYPTAEGVRCEVEDSGEGIDGEDLPRLFQRFSQLEGGAAKGGTGLGLSISRSIVEAHGGTIGVESQRGSGSTFWFTLPAGPAGAQAVPSADAEDHVD